MPSMPFSDWSVTSMPAGMLLATRVGNADAEIDVIAVAQLLRRAGGHLVTIPRHVTIFTNNEKQRNYRTGFMETNRSPPSALAR
jgi:hypothetical protein